MIVDDRSAQILLQNDEKLGIGSVIFLRTDRFYSICCDDVLILRLRVLDFEPDRQWFLIFSDVEHVLECGNDLFLLVFASSFDEVEVTLCTS